MLAPDTRTVAIELLRPPPDYRLEQAVLTTYSLDLEALLALPLAVLAHSDGTLDALLNDPLQILEALRSVADQVHVFVDVGGIAVPKSERSIYAMLESSVHPVRAPNGGAFHPKFWAARFVREDGERLLRVAVLSRNLTFDRSWDVALTSEQIPGTARRCAESRALGDLLRALPSWSTERVDPSVVQSMETLASELERTRFPSPERFHGPIEFHVIGRTRRQWRPGAAGARILAIAPFANRTALDTLAAATTGPRTLVSRQETLDALPKDALAPWETVLTLSDAAAAETERETVAQPNGLHAKIIAIEQGWDVSWFVGSANLTRAAFHGLNIEVMASVTGRKGRGGASREAGGNGVGIDRFLDAGFVALCEPYQPAELAEPDDALLEAQRRLDAVRKSLMGDGVLQVACTQHGEEWLWALSGEVALPDGVEVSVWPVSLKAEHSKRLFMPVTWSLPMARLTAFVSFRLRATAVKLDDVYFTLKLPTEGLPEKRLSEVLRTLVDSPESLFRFLRALLGGVESTVELAAREAGPTGRSLWGAGLGGETLLEDLIRVASRDPKRLDVVKTLIEGLRETADGHRIVPDDLHAVWVVVEEAIRARTDHATS